MAIEVAEDADNNINQKEAGDFLPFFVVKNRASYSRRRSSVQSWQQRHKYRLVRRLVRKSGRSSVHQKSSKERSYRFFLDLSNTLIESSWIWTLLIVSLAFILTWVMFAGFWAIISIENVDAWNGTTETCLEGIHSFSGYLLFSIETQSSIGYGGRYIKDYCPEAIIGLCVQLLIGGGVCGSLICIVFLKMGSPLRNRQMVCFSKKAVICQRDGELCLIFRVRDYEMRYECDTKIAAYLVEERLGELSLKTLRLQPTGILIWPLEVVHRIDASSPFWDLSAKDLIVKRFELVVVMEGSSLATSYMSRVTTSYLSREIKWGYKFVQCTEWNKEQRRYVVDHKLFNKTEEIVTPLCSAQRLAEVFYDVLYAGGSVTSKYSSPPTLSPLVDDNNHRFTSVSVANENTSSSSDDDQGSTKAVVSAQIHYQPDGKKADISSSSSSDCEEDEEQYTTFMDLSVEDLTRNKRGSVEIRLKTSGTSEARRTLSGTAKDFLVSLQKYVTEGSGKKEVRKYEETSF